MCLNKLDSYRIINVEMQMKRGHPPAFVGAFIVVPSTCLSWLDAVAAEPTARIERIERRRKEWEDALLSAKTRFVSLSDLAGGKKMKQKHPFFFVLLFVLKQHLRRRSSPINSQQRG